MDYGPLPLASLRGVHPRVLLQPIVLGNLVVEADDENPTTQFLHTFRINQPASVPGIRDGALLLIRAQGDPRSVVFFPVIVPRQPPVVGNRVIPLPEFPPDRQSVGTSAISSDQPTIEETGLLGASSSSTITEVKEEEEMGPFQGIWSCKCPVPGTQPMVPCPECRRRECFEWSWDREISDSTAVFQNSDREVLFNPGYSVGTVAVRGNSPLKQGHHHYWEIEMSSEVYGTDMMIGVGTDKADLRQHSHSFVSLIGLDEESWGLSYTGAKHHNGKVQHYTKSFGQHTVVGVHVDLWSGHLEFYINRKPIGRAFNGLQGKVLYPMISSTAARSAMNLVFCRSYAPSLQLQTMLSLGKSMLLPDNISLFKVLPDNIIPPGLKLWMKNNFWWITSNKEKKGDSISRKKTEKKGQSSRPTIIITDSTGPSTSQTGGSSQVIRRGRKMRKDDSSAEHQQELTAKTTTTSHQYERVTTRSMATRRTLIPGANPIFAPIPPDSPSPAKTLKVSSDVSKPITRSSSSPSVRDARHFDEDQDSDDDDNDLPPRAASSNSNEPGSKRMCLRSYKR